MKAADRDCGEWKLSAIDPHDRDTWRSGVRSYMHAASQLPGRGPLLWILPSTCITVYQRTPDIAISEVSECLQGHHTRSVFLDLLFVLYEL